VFTFLIHFGQWPIAQGSGTGSHLDPPDGFPDKKRQWISLQLTPEEMESKRKAIMAYHSQILVMGRFLLSFARSNELWMPDD
jgi:LmbE family N-acetylglucosaminyl deacetylase